LRSTIRALVGTAVAVAALALAAAAGATGIYPDASGDANGTIDIHSVTIMGTADGNVSVAVMTAGLSSAGADSAVVVYLDTDNNPSTGSKTGADYFLEYDPPTRTYYFAKWNGSDWADEAGPTIRVAADSVSVTFNFNVSDLGGSKLWVFYALAITGTGDSAKYDEAPDEQGGWFVYSLAANGPELRGVSIDAVPTAPHAGGTFAITPTSVSLAVNVGQGVPKPSVYRCTAKLNGKLLAGHGTGGCTLKVPAKTKGKKLVVVVSATYEGSTISLPYTYTVH
jgi:hypothetical protein